MSSKFENTEAFAKELDAKDPLRRFRDEFLIPKAPNGEASLYFVGNSLGLQPKKVRQYVEEELSDWAELGVEGHLHARHPWLPYHEFLTEPSARLVGAKPVEVVVMNSLTVNLHLMLVSFYRPTSGRFKILTEGGAFPSDQYAVASQARFHGHKPDEAILKCTPRPGENVLRTDDILETIEREGKSVALVLFGNVNYLTGQSFDMAAITRAAHAQGCLVGFDLAHGAGNLVCRLHDWNVDFAVWCSYKYLNSGPGGVAGCFVHERHCKNESLPRFEGWWGHNKHTRFQMRPDFDPIPSAEAWQLSNPPILPLASLRASLELFDLAGMEALRKKSELLTGYLEWLMERSSNGVFALITPRDPAQRGCQLSFRIEGKAKTKPRVWVEELAKQGVYCDFREPDVIRLAPVPLYNRFSDVYDFARLMETYARIG